MSEYTDIKNNTYIITNLSVVSDDEMEEIKLKLMEELYEIFTH